MPPLLTARATVQLA